MSSSTPEERRLANDLRVANDIQQYGCHVISVFDPEGKLPTFLYSIGIQETTGAPEAIVLGVRTELGHAMINAYCHQLRAGKSFARGIRYPDFLEGFDIYIEPARRKNVSDYVHGCDRYYGDKPYSVVQLVYPTTSGIWPWQRQAPELFLTNQPMLGRKRPSLP